MLVSQHWSSYTCMYIFFIFFSIIGFPNGSLERICLQCKRYGRCEFDPWVRKIPLKEEMATHSSILAWKILWTEEHAGLQSIGSQRVRHDWAHTHKILMLYRRTLLGFLTWGFFLVVKKVVFFLLSCKYWLDYLNLIRGLEVSRQECILLGWFYLFLLAPTMYFCRGSK